MGRIRILPEAVANKIAAGEVVERPASVVKELLENSLDAGASHFRLEVAGGGKQRIHAVDDGCGMGRDDALLAFERHATSKLRRAEDLLSVATMGFRGEALPSLGAVSRLTLETRSPQETSGTRMEIAGGRLLSVQEAGLPTGTAVTVSSLFYNMPARRKFLRSEATELSHITSVVTHYSLAYPEIAFQLRSQAGEVVNAPAVDSLRERVFQLFGEEMLEQLVTFGPRTAESFPSPEAIPPKTVAPGTKTSESIERTTEPRPVKLFGFLSRPQVQKLNRNSIYTFVNRRLIRDRVLLHAIQEAYHNILPRHSFPVALLFLEMPYEEVDVNVHPSKVEVRFRHQSFVHNLVRDALRECLTASKPVSTFPAGASRAPEPPAEKTIAGKAPETVPAAAAGFQSTPPPGQSPGQPPSYPQNQPAISSPARSFRFDPGVAAGSRTECGAAAVAAPIPETPSADAPPPASGSELADLRPLGQIQESFIVAASSVGLWLIDQHVAHERVLFEKFLSQRESGTVESQRLLLPYVLRLNAAQQAVWDRIQNELAAAGFEAEPFGQNTVAVKAAPGGVKADDVEKLLLELVESIEEEKRAFSPEAVRHKIAASVACHAAIKVNTPLEYRKMEWLLSELSSTRFPMSCPHGRPVVLKYEMREILKAFHRI